MIEFDDAQIGMAVAVSVFDEVFKEYYLANDLETFSLQTNPDDPDSLSIDLALNPPEFFMEQSDETSRTFLLLTGGFPNPLLPDEEVPVELKVRLIFTAVPAAEEGDVVKLGIAYGGIDFINDELQPFLVIATGADSPETAVTEFSESFAENSVIQAVTALELDIIRPLVEGLDGMFFSEDDNARPELSEWSVHIQLLIGQGSNRVDALGIFIALPETSAVPGNSDSFLINSHQLVLAYSRNFLDEALAIGASDQVGKEIDGAEITSLDLRMGDGAINVDGKVKKNLVTVSFDGPLHPSLIRGTLHILVDSSDVSADVPDAFEWFLKVLSILFIGVFTAIFKIFDAVDGIEEGAESQVQGALSETLGKALSGLTDGLKFNTEVSEISVISTTDFLNIVDGHMLFFNRIFVGKQLEEIDEAFYSKKLRKFVLFKLKSGLRLSAADLALLVGQGKIELLNHHDVAESFIRSDHDLTEHNNLLEIFGDNAPDEPTIADIPEAE